MSEVPSIELWAAAKFVGRECATVNREYMMCKKVNSSDPFACVNQETLATTCAANVVADLKTRAPEQFTAYTKCLNYNDYQYGKCRELEQQLKDSWSKAQGENKPATL